MTATQRSCRAQSSADHQVSGSAQGFGHPQFLGLGLAALILGLAHVHTAALRGRGLHSTITGLVLLIFPIGNLYSMLAPAGQAVFSNPADQAPSLGGLFNRLVLVLAFAWYIVLTTQLRGHRTDHQVTASPR